MTHLKQPQLFKQSNRLVQFELTILTNIIDDSNHCYCCKNELTNSVMGSPVMGA